MSLADFEPPYESPTERELPEGYAFAWPEWVMSPSGAIQIQNADWDHIAGDDPERKGFYIVHSHDKLRYEVVLTKADGEDDPERCNHRGPEFMVSCLLMPGHECLHLAQAKEQIAKFHALKAIAMRIGPIDERFTRSTGFWMKQQTGRHPANWSTWNGYTEMAIEPEPLGHYWGTLDPDDHSVVPPGPAWPPSE